MSGRRSDAARRIIPYGAMSAMLRLVRINLKLLFGRLWWIYLLGLLLWVGFQILSVYMGWNEEPWNAADAQNVLLTPPLLLLAIYLGMSSIAMEIDDRTIEGAFTIAGARYGPWIARCATVLAFLVVADFMLAGIGWMFLVDFPIIPVVFNALVPVVLYFALALMLSLLFKGTIPAGLAVSPILFLNITVLQGVSEETRYSVFFNYLDRPSQIDEPQWLLMAVQNRIGLLFLTGLILFYAIRLTDKRERLLQ